MDDVGELLRASTTDVAAVQKYLRSIGHSELTDLLDGFTLSSGKKSNESAGISGEQVDERNWQALMHLLLRNDFSRLKASTKILQALCKGSPTESEAMQWIAEVSIGYINAGENQSSTWTKFQVEVQSLVGALLNLLEGLIGENDRRHSDKVIAQILGLVPVVLFTSMDRNSSHASNMVHHLLGDLLEQPWDATNVHLLLEVLRECASLVSSLGWTQLHGQVRNLVLPGSSGHSEKSLQTLHECLSVAAVTENSDWVHLTRQLFQQLPANLLSEAEFDLQMTLQQYPTLLSLIPTSVQESLENAEDGRASDLLLLLHCLNASRPILTHRSSSLQGSSVFSSVEKVVLELVQDRGILGGVLQIGGKSVYAREWKARLLMEFGRVWLKSKKDVSQQILLTIFHEAPEIRREVLETLMEGCRDVQTRQVCMQVFGTVFQQEKEQLYAHVSAIKDWLRLLFQDASEVAKEGFLLVFRLSHTHRDLYHAQMIFLRKLVSSSNPTHQYFAFDLWCSFLEDASTPLDTSQEEELVSALQSCLQVCEDLQIFCLERLVGLFAYNCLSSSSTSILYSTVFQLLQSYLVLQDIDREEDGAFPQIQTKRLTSCYQKDTTIDGAVQLGIVVQRALECLLTCNRMLDEKDVHGRLLDLLQDKKSIGRWCSVYLKRKVVEKQEQWDQIASISVVSAVCGAGLVLAVGKNRNSAGRTGAKGKQKGRLQTWSLMETAFAVHRALVAMCKTYHTCYSKQKRKCEDVLKPFWRPLDGHVEALVGYTLELMTSEQQSDLPSIDTINYLLDRCSETNVECKEQTGMIETLVKLYLVVRKPALADVDDTTMHFMQYEEAIVSSFHPDVRYLVVSPLCSSRLVMLDREHAQDLLRRVCRALYHTIGKWIASEQDVNTELQRVLSEVNGETSGANGWIELAEAFANDLSAAFEISESSKLHVALAHLVKSLFNHGVQILPSGEDACWQVIEICYEVVCENAVQPTALLRVLLSVALSPQVVHQASLVGEMVERLESTLAGCGFQSLVKVVEPDVEEGPLTPVRGRKRLRQISAVDPPATAPFEEDEEMRKPLLTTSSSRSAALSCVVLVVESMHDHLLQQLSNGQVEEGLIQYITQAERVMSDSLLSTKQISSVDLWNSRILVKVLGIVENVVRLCKKAALLMNAVGVDSGILLMEEAVKMTLEGKKWTEWMKNHIQDASLKRKVSATSLKVDVFLLDVPQVVQSIRKEVKLEDAHTERLKTFVGQVTDMVASTGLVNGKKGVSKKRRGMEGMVPLVAKKKKKKRLRSRHPYIDEFLREEDGGDAYVDLEDFIDA